VLVQSYVKKGTSLDFFFFMYEKEYNMYLQSSKIEREIVGVKDVLQM
jgi:hypothetical protein